MATSLSPVDHAALAAAVDDLRRVFGTRLQAVAAYGLERRRPGDPLHAIVLVDRLTFDDLAECARLTPAWRKAGVGAPLLLERAEFDRTLDVFPLEYGEIIAHHVPIFGEDAFAGARVEEEDIRRAVEFHAKSLLIHLREGFIETGGEPAAVGGLIAGSAAGFHALLTNIARLSGDSETDLPAVAERQVGVSAATVREVLSAEQRGPSHVEDLTPLLTRYLDAAGMIWRHVDGRRDR
jgi:hypothetical protein